MLKNFLNLRNVVAIAICLAVTTTFSSCERNENGNGNGGNISSITATNVIGNTAEIASVNITLWSTDDEQDEQMVIAEAPFQNNGFRLELPESVPNNFLWLIAEDLEDGVTVSNINARGQTVWDIYALNADGNEIGSLSFTNFDRNSEEEPNVIIEALWFYVDRNVTITGEMREEWYDDWDGIEYIDIVNFNLNLRRGWNSAYVRATRTTAGNVVTYNVTFTSQRPANANLSWRFNSWWSGFDFELDSRSTRNTETPKNLFSRSR